jgi:hypothetical protein
MPPKKEKKEQFKGDEGSIKLQPLFKQKKKI